MTDKEKLYEILNGSTIQLRKGAAVTQEGGATHLWAMPHEDQVQPEVEKVDLHFVTIGVDRAKVEASKDEAARVMKATLPMDEMKGGPSYMNVGAWIGDQGTALQLFAFGQVAGWWKVITPATMGFEGAEADAMAGNGFVMCSGYREPSKA